MSIEVCLVVNLVADCILLGATCRIMGLYRPKRVFLCALLCAVYGTLAISHPRPWAEAPVHVAMLSGVSMLLARCASPRLWLPLAATLSILGMLCGGISLFMPLAGPVAAACCPIAGALLGNFALRQSAVPNGWQIYLCLRSEGRNVRFPALIDTGNRLREPISGQPVLIAEASLLRDVLPAGGYRTICYDALGGQGSMACFRPGEIWIEHGNKRRLAPCVWVAVCDDPLPGVFRALAPPEFAPYAR